VALTMRDVPVEKSREILVRIAARFDGHDRAYLEAFGIGCAPKESEIYHTLATSEKNPEKWSDTFAWIAWRLHSSEAVSDLKARALSPKLSNAQRKLMMDALAFVDSREAAMSMVDLAVAKDFPAQANALWWLFNRKDNLWKEFGLADVMKQRGLYDPDAIKLVEVVMPPAATEPSKLPPIPEILKLKGQAVRGKTAVTVCYTCHQIGGEGTDFGPNLTMFGKTQTREVLLKSMIDPSAEISHGFEGNEVIANDGTIIDGIVLTTGDPLIIKSMAGQIQTVPRSHIKSNKRLNRSLMFSADMLGLDAQALADIVAYLQSNDLK